MRPFVLILLPLLLLGFTGFIYDATLSWTTTCGTDITCQGGVTNPINTGDPMFALLTGNPAAMFSNLATIFTATNTVIAIPIPTFGIPYPAFAWPSVQWATWGNLNPCGVAFGAHCDFGVPYPQISSPFIGWNSWTINLGNLNVPVNFTALAAVGGILMLLIGIGLNFNLGPIGDIGIDVNERGAKTLQTLGLTVLLYTFTTSFSGGFVNSLGSPFNTIIFAIIALMVVIGALWQSQSEI